MQTFGEQLNDARKAKGMTQEELAQAVNVARNTISSWERGRTIPDFDTVRRLSDVLGVDFTQTAEEQSAASVTGAALPEGQTAPAETGRQQNKKWWIVGCAAVLVCAIVLCVLLFPRKSATSNGGKAFNMAYYRQEVPNEAGKAYLKFSNKVWEERNGEDEFQYYTFNIIEANGVAFSIARIDTQMETKTGALRSISFSAADLTSFMLNPDLVPYGSMPLQGGFPKGEVQRVGITVYGSDANGETLTFYSLIEF